MRAKFRLTSTTSLLGFTAIELSAVATIIAILALILIPVLRKRVEEAKITAANADMKQIETVQMTIHADTGYYVRLFEMTRPTPETDDSATVKQQKLPKATWNIPSDTGIHNTFKANWKGPYAAPHRSRTLYEIVRGYEYLFRGENLQGLTVQQGPVLLLQADDTDEFSSSPNYTTQLEKSALTRLKYPVDPWGNPYIFFGTGKIGTYGYETAIEPEDETNFNTAVVYCTGPNGVPGNVTNPISKHYFRETPNALGTEDDLVFEF